MLRFFLALKPLKLSVKLAPEVFRLRQHLLVKAVEVVPVAAEERVLPEQVPQRDGHVVLLAVVAVLCVFSSHCFDLKVLKLCDLSLKFCFAPACC